MPLANGIGIGLPFGGNGAGGPTVPLLQNVSVTMGAKTPLNMGTVLLKNLGLVATGSAPIANWRTTITSKVGGGATSDLSNLSSNTANATARSPAPTLGANNSLTTTTLAATSYAITVTGVTAGGLEATCTLTYVIQAGAFNLGDNNAGFGDPDDLINDTLRIRLGTKTGGLTMLLSTGADLTNQVLIFAAFVPASGRTTVQYADPARPSRIPNLRLSNTNSFDVTGLSIGGGYNVHKIWLDGTCDGSTVKNTVPLGDSVANVSIGNQDAGNVNFIYLNGVSNCTVDNNYLLWGGRGITLSGTTGCTVSNNVIRYFYGDAEAISTSTNDTVTGNQAYAPMRDTDTGINPDHIDMRQWDVGPLGGSTPTNLTYHGQIYAQADGTAAASGFQGGYNTYTGVDWRFCITLFRASTAANLAAWQDSTIADSTWLLVGSGKVSQAASGADDNVFNGQPGFTTTGGAGANALTRVFVPYTATMGGTWTVTNSPNHTFSIPLAVQFPYTGVTFNLEPDMGGSTYATSGIFKYANTLERLNNYNALTNTAGADYPNMTPAQIKALILDVLTPATGGSLDLGGANNNTIGAVCLDGTLKTASPSTADAILLESGSYLLIESGSKLLKE